MNGDSTKVWTGILAVFFAAVLGNVGAQIILKIGANDAQLLARSLEKIEPIDLVNLPNYRNWTL